VEIVYVAFKGVPVRVTVERTRLSVAFAWAYRAWRSSGYCVTTKVIGRWLLGVGRTGTVDRTITSNIGDSFRSPRSTLRSYDYISLDGLAPSQESVVSVVEVADGVAYMTE